VCIAGFVGSFQASSEKWIDQSVPADLFVTSSAKVAGIQNTPMQPELAEELTHVEGVSNANRIRLYAHDVLGLRVFIVSLDPEVYYLRGKPTILAGTLPTEAQRAQGYVTISENLARRRDLKPGSTFPVNSPTGLLTYTVAAVITDYSSDQGAIFLDRRYFTAQFNDALVDTIHLYVDDLSKLETVRQAITAKYGAKYDLYVLSNAELRKEAYDLVGNAFSVTYAMELVAVVLALLGVINTLLAAVLDRTREIGLLRAIGADKGHVLKLFTGEAAFIGLTGSAIGVLVGIVLGILVTKVVGVQATGWNFPYLFPWKLALQMGVGATVCAIVAGIYPARRAAGLDVVEALAYE
jgi:putative ABC transport system permease protein